MQYILFLIELVNFSHFSQHQNFPGFYQVNLNIRNEKQGKIYPNSAKDALKKIL